jgi:hypothetical protein
MCLDSLKVYYSSFQALQERLSAFRDPERKTRKTTFRPFPATIISGELFRPQFRLKFRISRSNFGLKLPSATHLLDKTGDRYFSVPKETENRKNLEKTFPVFDRIRSSRVVGYRCEAREKASAHRDAYTGICFRKPHLNDRTLDPEKNRINDDFCSTMRKARRAFERSGV